MSINDIHFSQSKKESRSNSQSNLLSKANLHWTILFQRSSLIKICFHLHLRRFRREYSFQNSQNSLAKKIGDKNRWTKSRSHVYFFVWWIFQCCHQKCSTVPVSSLIFMTMVQKIVWWKSALKMYKKIARSTLL